jgi:hypothetical protein
MLEVVLALVIFTMMALMTAALVPMAARSNRYGNDYAQAATLAMHKINQLQEAGYTNINRNLNGTLLVVDSNGSLPTTATNVNGAGSGSATFTTRDGLSSYFVGGASDPVGTIYVAPYTPSLVSTGVYAAIEARVLITWRDVRGRQQSFSVKTIISKSPIL